MNKFVFLGSPGAGKGTIAGMLAKDFSIVHISTGDIIRSAIANKTELGLKVQSLVESGSLVPDDLMIKLVEERFKDPDLKDGFILDGFPRTLNQAEAVFDLLDIKKAVFFDISEDEVIKRLSGRRVHKASGRTYHIIYNPPRVQDKDDLTGEDLITREDDRPEAIKKRLDVYKESTHPLVSFYKEKGKLFTIDASKSIDEVYLLAKDIFNS